MLSEKLDKAMHGEPEPHLSASGKYLRPLVYGGLDGIITTFAVVAGVAGAALAPAIVLILGFANLIGDGISMSVGSYLSNRAEHAYHKAERKREAWEIENWPKKEYQELLEFYEKKGFSKQDTKKLADIIFGNKQATLEVMMIEELGIIVSENDPFKEAAVTFFSFLCFGFIPLLTYVLAAFIVIENTFVIACVLTALTLFLLGTVKVKVTAQNWFKAGLETLLVGGIAATAAYGIGYFISTLV